MTKYQAGGGGGLRSGSTLPTAPSSVEVPLIVWVVPAVKLICLAPSALVSRVKLLKVVLPETVAVVVLSRVTVWVPGTPPAEKLPPEIFQFLSTVMFNPF